MYFRKCHVYEQMNLKNLFKFDLNNTFIYLFIKELETGEESHWNNLIITSSLKYGDSTFNS